MKKLKKMLMTISLIAITSCADKNLPESPELEEGGPVYVRDSEGKLFVKHFHLQNNKTQAKTNISIEESKERIILCTDVDSYNRAEEYKAKLERLARKRCQ